MRICELFEEQQTQALHLTRLPKYHKGEDALAEYVPQRLTHLFALHPEKWQSTFFSLTNKDPRKLKYYRPVMVDIVPGTLVGDMVLANQFYRADTPEKQQYLGKLYRDSVKPWPVDVSQYRFPELLIPRG